MTIAIAYTVSLGLQQPIDEELRLPSLNLLDILWCRFRLTLEPKVGPLSPGTGSVSDPVFGVRFGATIGIEAGASLRQAPFWIPSRCALGPGLAALTGASIVSDLESPEPSKQRVNRRHR